MTAETAPLGDDWHEGESGVLLLRVGSSSIMIKERKGAILAVSRSLRLLGTAGKGGIKGAISAVRR
jgi:hypothetical protein